MIFSDKVRAVRSGLRIKAVNDLKRLGCLDERYLLTKRVSSPLLTAEPEQDLENKEESGASQYDGSCRRDVQVEAQIHSGGAAKDTDDGR